MTPNVDQDEYGEVINGELTYKALAMHLLHAGSAIIGWTDQDMTHLDILLVLKPYQAGNLQGGMKGATDLFVGVRGFGMFGFDISHTDTHPGYIGEKLGLGGANVTTEKLADLINNIRKLVA